MKREWNSVKRLGLGVAVAALVGAGGMLSVRAADPQPLYRVSSDAVVSETALRAAIDPLFDEADMGEDRKSVV